jgi:hypothetical protein
MNPLPDSILAPGDAASASRSPHIGQLVRQSLAAMTARERARLIAMYGVIAGLQWPGSSFCSRSWCPRISRGSGYVWLAVLAYTWLPQLRSGPDSDGRV